MDRARVKICGVTSLTDARMSVDAGADAIGLNFWPASKRRCELDEAARIVEALSDRARIVAVFVDPDRASIDRVRAIGVPWVQLHGEEPRELLEELLPDAYKAVHPADEADVARALAWPGDELLVDARVEGMPGGTGQRASWPLAREIARGRKVWLAGGLTPDIVGEAIAAVRPHGVDVASGVERAPGIKDADLVERFVRAVRGAPC